MPSYAIEFSIREKEMSLLLFTLSLISFNHALYLLVCKAFTSFVKFIPIFFFLMPLLCELFSSLPPSRLLPFSFSYCTGSVYCWTEVMKAEIFTLFPVFEESFQSLIKYAVRYGFFKNTIFQVSEIPFHSSFLERFFFNHQGCWNLPNASSVSIEMVYILYPGNMQCCTDCFVDVKPTLPFWINSSLLQYHPFHMLLDFLC